jgi:quercetin dioxygenase-like cupin family protein
MKIVKTQNKEWLQKEGYSKKILLDENELNHKGGLVQLIKLKPGERAETHHHKEQTEIFYFLTKNGYWVINNEKFEFEIGDTLVIEPNDKHLIINDTDQDYIYLVFKYDYAPDDLYWC